MKIDVPINRIIVPKNAVIRLPNRPPSSNASAAMMFRYTEMKNDVYPKAAIEVMNKNNAIDIIHREAFPCLMSQIETINSASPERSWFIPMNNTHSHCQKPKNIMNKVNPAAMKAPKCVFANIEFRDSSNSHVILQINRKANSMMVIKIIANRITPNESVNCGEIPRA